MKYTMELTLEPARHFLHVLGKIEAAEGGCFYLNESFTLLRAESGGRKIPFVMEKGMPHPPFDQVSRPVFFHTENREVEFEYEGYLPGAIAGVNQISRDEVELASYSGWYPKPENPDIVFDFEIKLSLPEGYEIASNGRCLPDGRIVSAAPDFDIAVFASPILKRFTCEEEQAKISFLCPADMLPQMERRAKEILWANRFFAEKFGGLSNQADKVELVSVFRPSGGWGYKRGNASFVSADWGRKEQRYQGDFHELAHGWWSIASVQTNDWINEGGAEFSAFSAARALYGEAYAEQRVEEYLKEIRESGGKTSIVDTGPDSPERYVNHYYRTTVMYLRAQERFGAERVFGLLKKVFQTYQNTRNADTAGFLSLCDSDMRPFFERYLFAKNWEQEVRDPSA